MVLTCNTPIRQPEVFSIVLRKADPSTLFWWGDMRVFPKPLFSDTCSLIALKYMQKGVIRHSESNGDICFSFQSDPTPLQRVFRNIGYLGPVVA